MWTKDDYQKHMLGYLDGVRIEIDRLARLQRHTIDEFYIQLDIALDCLLQLSLASDVEWERFRHILEASCDELLRTFYRAQPTGPSILSMNVVVIDIVEETTQTWKPVAAVHRSPR
jgi:hypothetical protein